MPKKVLQFFCAILYLIYRFVHILHKMVKSRFVRGGVIGWKFTLSNFFNRRKHIWKHICITLHNIHRILYVIYIKLEFISDWNTLNYLNHISRNYQPYGYVSSSYTCIQFFECIMYDVIYILEKSLGILHTMSFTIHKSIKNHL